MMNKIIKIGLFFSILSFTMVIPCIFVGFLENKVPLSVVIAFLYLITGIILFKQTYSKFLCINRNSQRWCKIPSNEELEIVEDAKELIKSVDSKIVISKFNVYKVRFVMHAWFEYDASTKELNIFIPFKLLLKHGGKDLCFLAVLHEVLHSQNLKDNLLIFNKEFIEGINQLLTIWLINNYSKKYKIPKNKSFSIRLTKNYSLVITRNQWANMVYPKEVNIVKNILQKSNMDYKQVFLKYIDFEPEFFRSFVPSKYFKKQ